MNRPASFVVSARHPIHDKCLGMLGLNCGVSLETLHAVHIYQRYVGRRDQCSCPGYGARCWPELGIVGNLEV
jgi:hypothetical protein